MKAYRPGPVHFRRVMGMSGLLLLLVALVSGGAMAAPNAPADTTLTLAKTTLPAGGEDFAISAVGFLNHFETSLKSPRDIERDNSNRLYVVGHRASKVEVFSADGTSLDLWGTKGHDQQEMFRPEDLAVVDDGVGITVIVADTGNNRLQVYDDVGNYIDTLGELGTGDGQFNGPQGVATDADGNIYVADTNNHRIQVLDSSGAFVRKWGSEGSAVGQFKYPAGVDVGPDGQLYIADSNNNRIMVYKTDGTYVRTIGKQGSGPGEFNLPTQTAVADDGTIFVGDTYNHRVQKLTTSGRFLTMWGSEGTGPGEFERPNGLVVMPDGTIYVVDIDNERIEVFKQMTAMLDDAEEKSFNVPATTYQITEPGTTNWELSDVVCQGATATPIATGVSVALVDGVPVKCTFTNESNVPGGSVSVLKYHDLDLSGTNTAGDLPLAGWTFRLRDAGNAQIGDDKLTDATGHVVFEDLAAGNYQVCEVLPVGWFNTQPGVAGEPIPGTGGEVCAPVVVTTGQTTNSSFGNVAAATLTVAKSVEPEGSLATFAFSSAVPELNGTIGDGGQLTADVWPGTYTATEAPSGYTLSSVVCDDSDSMGDIPTRTATFKAGPGESVTCTFVNTASVFGTIATQVYQDEDESGSFSGTDTPLANWPVKVRDSGTSAIVQEGVSDAAGLVTFAGLPAASYQVCQVLPVGWFNVDPGSLSGPVVGAGQEICVVANVAASELTNVTFGNVEAATLTVVKMTEPADSTTAFDFTSDVAELSGSLKHGEHLTAVVWPGSYSVTEGAAAGGYELTGIACSNAESTVDLPSRKATFSAGPGESVTCTFTNTLDTTGTVAAHLYEDLDESGDHSTGDAPLQGWSVLLRDSVTNGIVQQGTSDAAGLVTLAGVLPKTYKACVVVPEGWINVEPGNNGQPVVGNGQEVCSDVAVTAGTTHDVMFGNIVEPEPESFSLYLPVVARP